MQAMMLHIIISITYLTKCSNAAKSYASNFNCSYMSGCNGESLPCLDNDDCVINCEQSVFPGSQAACEASTIKCPQDHICNVSCIGETACWGASILAVNSSQLFLFGCSDLFTCDNIDIYCPPNVNGEKKCHISGNDNGLTNCNNCQGYVESGREEFNLYAINGWDDIDFSSYTGDKYTNVNTGSGKMHCTNNYNLSCTISTSQWACNSDTTTVCSNYTIPTGLPTVSPTTISPTTVSPTTVSPTTISPTTISPTTISPTDLPTISPTTISPIIAMGNYGIIFNITINLHNSSANTTHNIVNILQQLSNSLINSTYIDIDIDSECIPLMDENDFHIHANINAKVTVIKGKIVSCDSSSQQKLFAVVENSDLETDLIENIKQQLNIEISLQLETERIWKNTEINTTNINTTVTTRVKIEKTENGDMFWSIIAVVFSVIILCILALCVLIFFKHRKAKKYKFEETGQILALVTNKKTIVNSITSASDTDHGSSGIPINNININNDTKGKTCTNNQNNENIKYISDEFVIQEQNVTDKGEGINAAVVYINSDEFEVVDDKDIDVLTTEGS